MTSQRLRWSGTIAVLDTPSSEPGTVVRMICSQPTTEAPWNTLPIPLTSDATSSRKERIGSVDTIRIDGNRVHATGKIDTTEPPGTRLPVAVSLESPCSEPDDGTLRVTTWRITQVGLTERPCFPEAVITLYSPESEEH